MNAMLTSLSLKKFRSIPSEKVEFSNPTFLIGQNGAGKSNLADAIAFLSEAMTSPLQAVFDVRGGISSVRNKVNARGYPPNLGLGVALAWPEGPIERATYAFEIKAVQDFGFEVLREQCRIYQRSGEYLFLDRKVDRLDSNMKAIGPVIEPNSLLLPVVGGDSNLSPIVRFLSSMRVYSIEPAKLREMQDPDGGTRLKRDGSNVASVLQEIARQSEDDVERLRTFLQAIVPQTKSVTAKKHGNKLSLEFVQEMGGERSREPNVKFEAFNMSDGTLRALGLITSVFQRPRPSLMVMEEPEATIHPGAISAILDLLYHASESTQVIVTTHSTDLLDNDRIDDENLRIVSWDQGATRISGVSEQSRAAIRNHLFSAGELLRNNSLTDTTGMFRDGDLRQLQLFPE